MSNINAQEINWMTIGEAEEANKKEPKKILIDVYTDWCGKWMPLPLKTKT